MNFLSYSSVLQFAMASFRNPAGVQNDVSDIHWSEASVASVKAAIACIAKFYRVAKAYATTFASYTWITEDYAKIKVFEMQMAV